MSKNVRSALEEIIENIRSIRDTQNEMICEEDECICERFDIVIDYLESIIKIFTHTSQNIDILP